MSLSSMWLLSLDWVKTKHNRKTPAIGFTIVDNVRGIWHFIYKLINAQYEDSPWEDNGR